MNNLYLAMVLVGAILAISSVPLVFFPPLPLPAKFSRTRLIIGVALIAIGILLMWLGK